MKDNMKSKIRTMTFIALFSAVSIVLMIFEISLPFMPDFIKFDFSDLPALICAYAFGPLSGVLVCLLKNLLHLFMSQTAGIGELANFIMGSAFAFTAGIIYKLKKTRSGALIASLSASAVMGIISFPVNYFIVYPLYSKIGFAKEAILGMYQVVKPSVSNLAQALLIFNVPFTMVKGILVAAIAFLIYKPLSPLLKGKYKK